MKLMHQMHLTQPAKSYQLIITIITSFQKILMKSNHEPDKIWIGKGNEFYYRSMKSWLQKMP